VSIRPHLPTKEKTETENDPCAEYSKRREKKEGFSGVLAAGIESGEGVAGALRHTYKILEVVHRDAPATPAKSAA
jgi:hypothetical protein